MRLLVSAVMVVAFLSDRAAASFTICSININQPPLNIGDYALGDDSFIHFDTGERVSLSGGLRLVERRGECPPVSWDFNIADLHLHGTAVDLWVDSGSALLPPNGEPSVSITIAREIERLTDTTEIVETTALHIDPDATSVVTYSESSLNLPETARLELLIWSIRTETELFPGGGRSSVGLDSAILGTARLTVQRVPEASGDGLVLLVITGLMAWNRTRTSGQ